MAVPLRPYLPPFELKCRVGTIFLELKKFYFLNGRRPLPPLNGTAIKFCFAASLIYEWKYDLVV